MTGGLTIFLPQDAVRKIASAESSKGWLGLTKVDGDDFYVVDRLQTKHGNTIPVTIDDRHRTLKGAGSSHEGQWLRDSRTELAIAHPYLGHRCAGMAWEAFKEHYPAVSDPGNGTGVVIVHHPNVPDDLRSQGVPEFAGWKVTRDLTTPIPIHIEPAILGIRQLQGLWPVDLLSDKSVLIVGCGSVGGAAAEALARYGIGHVSLLDPDRYLWHNAIRHVLPESHIGQYKVDALRAHLSKRWPNTTPSAFRQDVVQDADTVRTLLSDMDAVICAADGIAPRRVVSHLARRAGKPAIMACVLHKGAIGEVLRLRPEPRFGCLMCQRWALLQAGALDAEADQELDYGTGVTHQPMTAVPEDLHIIGALAAKAAVCTLLEQSGDHTQRLPGEHALLGLRPTSDLAAPFDLHHAGETRWGTIPPPREGCFTCSPA